MHRPERCHILIASDKPNGCAIGLRHPTVRACPQVLPVDAVEVVACHSAVADASYNNKISSTANQITSDAVMHVAQTHATGPGADVTSNRDSRDYIRIVNHKLHRRRTIGRNRTAGRLRIVIRGHVCKAGLAKMMSWDPRCTTTLSLMAAE